MAENQLCEDLWEKKVILYVNYNYSISDILMVCAKHNVKFKNLKILKPRLIIQCIGRSRGSVPGARHPLCVINKSRLIFRLTIDRDAIWIGRDVANIYRDTSRRIIDIWKHIDVNSFVSLIN